MATGPILHLIAGVNGAGKTSFYRYFLERMTPGAEFVNADELARERWPGHEDEHVVEAAGLAAARRKELLDARKTFVAETVFSHESKLELVKAAQRLGLRVFLYHVHVGSAELARARIATRVRQGGHDVPGDKVEARYERTLRLIPSAASFADMTLRLRQLGNCRDDASASHDDAQRADRDASRALARVGGSRVSRRPIASSRRAAVESEPARFFRRVQLFFRRERLFSTTSFPR